MKEITKFKLKNTNEQHKEGASYVLTKLGIIKNIGQIKLNSELMKLLQNNLGKDIEQDIRFMSNSNIP